jgi:hypothetical protein
MPGYYKPYIPPSDIGPPWEMPLEDVITALHPEKIKPDGSLPSPEELGWDGPYNTMEDVLAAIRAEEAP